MTVPDRFPREADVPAGKESTVSVSETAVAGPAIAVTRFRAFFSILE
jgi:hypothetical protein